MWRCMTCSYIYDQEVGDPGNDVAAGTSFADISEDWVCPICGADKTAFEKM